MVMANHENPKLGRQGRGTENDKETASKFALRISRLWIEKDSGLSAALVRK
jgi:hypothetical protein